MGHPRHCSCLHLLGGLPFLSAIRLPRTGNTNFPETWPGSKIAAVFGTAGRRAVDSLVTLFAVLGFCSVPLGSKTGFQHTVALLETRPAREAASGLISAVNQVRALFTKTFLRETLHTEPLPIPSGRSTGNAPVRAIPPRLR